MVLLFDFGGGNWQLEAREKEEERKSKIAKKDRGKMELKRTKEDGKECGLIRRERLKISTV